MSHPKKMYILKITYDVHTCTAQFILDPLRAFNHDNVSLNATVDLAETYTHVGSLYGNFFFEPI